jgi:hypothetical protein
MRATMLLCATGGGIAGPQARHRFEKAIGIDIRADLAGDGRSLEKRAAGRMERRVDVVRRCVPAD